MSWDWKKHSNDFRFNKEQVVRLAGWYCANKGNGTGFSVALKFALAPAGKFEPDGEYWDAIWPQATIEDAPHIVELIEHIQKIDNGDSRFWWCSLPDKEGPSKYTFYVSYTFENWIREGLGLSIDESLEVPALLKADYTLDISDDTNE